MAVGQMEQRLILMQVHALLDIYQQIHRLYLILNYLPVLRNEK